MFKKWTKRGRWGAALVAAFGLCIAGLSLPAQAAEGDISVGNINPETSSSLTIHKYDGDHQVRGDGTLIADASGLGTPLVGVEFTIQRVTEKGGEAIDLDTHAGWNLIDGVVASDVTSSPYTLGNGTVVTTGPTGSTAQTNLAHGLYLVTETGHGTHNIISEVEPFLVTLPLPQGNGDWLYDVHAYPKNKTNQTEPTKTVANPGALVLGSDVQWTITAPVPAIQTGETYKSFVITDDLDSRLTYKSVDSVTFDGTALNLGTDYTVSNVGQLVTVTFTGGLGVLTAGKDVVVKLTTSVDSLGETGIIDNTAAVNTNGSQVTTNEPTTNWGPLEILKYAEDDDSNTLAGAQFEVYTSKDDSGTPVATLTTGADGKALITLWVGNNDVTQKTYWLKEIAAPAGYTLPTGDLAWTEVEVEANGAENPVEIRIANTQKDHPNLPFTGANGQLLLTMGGLGLLMVAVGTAIVRRRREVTV